MMRSFSDITLKEAMEAIPAKDLTLWPLNTPHRKPSDVLLHWLHRLRVFDQYTSETAKLLLIDALLTEVAPDHAGIRIWKSTLVESESMAGLVDYVIAPDFAYLTTPLLCIAEAKRDDFVQGRAQCIAEMVACRINNRLEGHEMDLYGIVSNGQDWQFYSLASLEVYESDIYTMRNLPELLGVLDHVIAQCASNVPKT